MAKTANTKKQKEKTYREELDLPQGLHISLNTGILSVKGPKGELKRKFAHPFVSLALEGQDKVVFTLSRFTRREKTILGTFKAHIQNMVKGVQNPYVYTLKVCSGHFPMNITCTPQQFVVKNFIGEKIPRVLSLKQGVTVQLSGDVVTVTSIDKDLAGETAGAIELLCRRPGFDRRIFQQGIFIMTKAGKAI